MGSESSLPAAASAMVATAASAPMISSTSTSVAGDQPKEQSLAIVTTKNFISGIVGGGCEAFVGYPLETVKARMQTQDAQAFTGPFDCLQKSIKEGGVSSLYRGASPQIFRSAVRYVRGLTGMIGEEVTPLG